MFFFLTSQAELRLITISTIESPYVEKQKVFVLSLFVPSLYPLKKKNPLCQIGFSSSASSLCITLNVYERKLAGVFEVFTQILTEMASLVAQTVKHLPAMRETWVQSLGREDPLEKEMATHSSTLAWKIPWTEDPRGLHPWDCKQSDTTE